MSSDFSGDKASQRYLADLINRACAIADALDLSMVGIRLDQARTALLGNRAGELGSEEIEDAFDVLAGRAPNTVEANDNVTPLHETVSMERLLCEHDDLDAQRRALMHLAEGPPATAEAFFRLTKFAEAIRAHRAHEQRCVYGPLIAIERRSDLGLGMNLRDIVGEIEGDWDSYLYRWTEEAMASDWYEFSLDTQRILTRAGERLRIENQVIYPLALQKGTITLREVR